VAFRSQRRADEPDQRSIVLVDLTTGDEQILPGPAGVRELAWCGPNVLVYAATVGQERLLGRLDLATGKGETLVGDFQRLWSPACSPDGERLVFVGIPKGGKTRQLWLLDAGEHAPVQIGRARGRHDYPVFSPDGRSLAFRWAPSQALLGEAELFLLKLKRRAGEPRSLTSSPTFRRSRRRLRFAPDGKSVYYMEAVRRGGRLWRQPLAGDEPIPVLALPYIHTFDYDLAPDGQTLIFPRVGRKGDLYLLERQETE